MKVRPSVKPMCEKCKIIKRKGKVMVEKLRSSFLKQDPSPAMALDKRRPENQIEAQ